MPKSASAIAARRRFDRLLDKADDQYRASVDLALHKCAAELEIAVKRSMRVGNLDEATQMRAEASRIKTEMAAVDRSSGRSVFLDDLPEQPVTGAQWPLTKHGMIHGSAIKVGGKTYPHGMGFNPSDGATVRIIYKLTDRYKRLTGAAGINDTGKGYGGKITFRILGDGRELWSKPLHEGGVPIPFDVDVNEVQTLSLVTECPGGAAGAHVVWLDAQLTGRGK
ncbi:MAG TPA: NPCBM/NEW2 domain-containing protein [Humisphaera sp.]|nr:NPCBM/NEW2 domain-containing protein [Humisphaera sp.]